MKRLHLVLGLLALSTGVISGASASMFASCQPTGQSSIAVTTDDLTRQWIVDYSTLCGAGDLNSCCINLVTQGWAWDPGGFWVYTGEMETKTNGKPCGVPSTLQTKFQQNGGAGKYRFSATIANCAKTQTFGVKTVEHTFP